MPDRAINTAHELTDALKENTTALRSVKRRFRFVIVFVVMLALVLALVVKSRYDARVGACEKDTDLRGGLLHIADQIEAGVERDPETGKISPENQQFIDNLRSDFAITVNCDEISWI